MAILKEDPPDLPVSERHIPPALARIVDRCLEKNPAARFQSATDLAFALDALSTTTGSAEGVHAATKEPPKSRGRWWVSAGASFVLGLVVASVATSLYMRPAEDVNQTRFSLTAPELFRPFAMVASSTPA
jgi:hypothetical protein